jgi:hypothetical protein
MKEQAGPSVGKLIRATVFALILAAVVLVVAVLPAEYGIDPLGTGKLLGLTKLAEESGATRAPMDLKALAEAKPTPIGNKQLSTPPVLTDWNRDQTRSYKVDSRKFELPVGGQIEFKYQIRKGSNLVYSWRSTGKVKYEFHGEPNAGPNGTYQSYAKDDKVGAQQGNGSFTAPFSGIHGWYWENASSAPVTIELQSAGFYTQAELFPIVPQGEHKTVELEDVKVPN